MRTAAALAQPRDSKLEVKQPSVWSSRPIDCPDAIGMFPLSGGRLLVQRCSAGLSVEGTSLDPMTSKTCFPDNAYATMAIWDPRSGVLCPIPSSKLTQKIRQVWELEGGRFIVFCWPWEPSSAVVYRGAINSFYGGSLEATEDGDLSHGYPSRSISGDRWLVDPASGIIGEVGALVGVPGNRTRVISPSLMVIDGHGHYYHLYHYQPSRPVGQYSEEIHTAPKVLYDPAANISLFSLDSGNVLVVREDYFDRLRRDRKESVLMLYQKTTTGYDVPIHRFDLVTDFRDYLTDNHSLHKLDERTMILSVQGLGNIVIDFIFTLYQGRLSHTGTMHRDHPIAGFFTETSPTAPMPLRRLVTFCSRSYQVRVLDIENNGELRTTLDLSSSQVCSTVALSEQFIPYLRVFPDGEAAFVFERHGQSVIHTFNCRHPCPPIAAMRALITETTPFPMVLVALVLQFFSKDQTIIPRQIALSLPDNTAKLISQAIQLPGFWEQLIADPDDSAAAQKYIEKIRTLSKAEAAKNHEDQIRAVALEVGKMVHGRSIFASGFSPAKDPMIEALLSIRAPAYHIEPDIFARIIHQSIAYRPEGARQRKCAVM